MAGRRDAARSRAVGRYDLVVEMAKSQLGALWAASAPESNGPEPRTVRRTVLGAGVGQPTREALLGAARWSTQFGSRYAADTLDIVHDAEELALVTSYQPGETLKALLRLANFKRQSIPPRVALRIALDTCEALCAAELRTASAPQGPDFLWGGLLPDSITVGTDGISRLLDIGVAAIWQREVPAAEHPEVTSYRAPEQLERGVVDSRADVFALGTLLWEMLSGGKRLFVGSSHRAVADKLKQHYVPPLSLAGPADLDTTALQALVSKMLEQDPRRRFRSVDDLRQTLLALGDAVALPMEASDFVTMFASSSLASRERVLQRALHRSPPIQPAVSVAKPAPAVSGIGAPAFDAGRPEAPQRVDRTSSPGPLRQSNPPPAPMRPRAESPPRGARPLPLPVQAKLRSRVSAPDGVLPPPPVAALAKRPSLPDLPVADDDASESVRAEDILAALEVEEDLGPDSDAMPTLRPEEPTAPVAPATAAEPLPLVAPPVPARPPIETIPGVAPPANSPGAVLRETAPPAVSPAQPTETPTAGASDTAGANPPIAALASPGINAQAAVPAGEADGAPRARPARGRLPTLLIASLAGGALVLLLGLGFALSGDDDAVSDTREAENSAPPSRTLGTTVADKKSEPEKPAADAPVTTTTTNDEPAEKKPAESDTPEDSGADTDDTVANGETPSPATPVTPPAAPRPGARQAPAPPPPRATAPKRKKIRAKRSFIPSGI